MIVWALFNGSELVGIYDTRTKAETTAENITAELPGASPPSWVKNVWVVNYYNPIYDKVHTFCWMIEELEMNQLRDRYKR